MHAQRTWQENLVTEKAKRHSPITSNRARKRTARHIAAAPDESVIPDSTPCVCIVDADIDIRESLQRLVEPVGLPARSYQSASAFLEKVEDTACRCLVAEIQMPRMNGLNLLRHLVKRGIMCPTIITTRNADIPAVVRIMKAGAADVIQKPFDDHTILERMRDEFENGCARHSAVVRVNEIKNRLAHLTPREGEVMNLIVEGKPNKQAAATLGLSSRTVERYRAQVMEKMNADSLADLVRMGITIEDEVSPARDDCLGSVP